MTSLEVLTEIHAAVCNQKFVMAEALLQTAIKDLLWQRHQQEVSAKVPVWHFENKLTEVRAGADERVIGYVADAELAPIADSGPVPLPPALDHLQTPIAAEDAPPPEATRSQQYGDSGH